eukprot:CAMPEP_0174255984 /NCGR_PEP_ID=MMETSP0439-20130205/5262_1 /TAXON_ID=0 /ORGANISM="Stereomyxa ramosa, Strain Chinc5" /LENGTH=289 /DNA_ID=CAMNT_0015338395 /DNA_START=121 /DNA_END=987 /DNA_ORIENTATION=+
MKKGAMKPKLACTVLVLGGVLPELMPPSSNYRVLMVKRSNKARFMPGAHVFPGGIIEQTDNDPRWLELYEDVYASRKANLTMPENVAIRLGGIREIFEESGVLITDPPFLEPKRKESTNEKEEELHVASYWRPIVNKNPEKFLEMFEELNQKKVKGEGIVPDIKRLIPWSHWITPEKEKWRYDTYFYVAPLQAHPSTIHALHDSKETVDYDWFAPEEALQSYDKGEIMLPFPTWYLLHELTQFNKLEEVIEIGNKGGRSLEPTQPLMRMDSATQTLRLTLPDGSVYQFD